MRILMPIDGSADSKAALDFIASRSALIASPSASPSASPPASPLDIELLNVQYPVSARVARGAGRELVRHYHETEASKVIKPALASLKKAGLLARVKSVVGIPGVEVGRVAGEDGADLIVMGSQGHTGFKRLLFGSVTQAVLASCTTPMLVLRSGGLPKSATNSVSNSASNSASKSPPTKDALKVGIALDGSKYGLAAVRFLIKHLTLFGATPTLTLVHVVPDLSRLRVPGLFADAPVPGFKPEQVAEMQRAAFERALAPARKLLNATTLHVTEAQLTGNNPGDVIAAFATKNKLDILALGSHGEGGFIDAVLGSVATRVAARCRCALLLIQAK